MSEFSIRAARADDLPRLTQLLPAWALDTAGFVDGDGDEQLLLALTASAPLACLRVQRHVGLGDPRYWFHVGCRVHAASELGMFRRERTLLLGNDHTGAAEISDFALVSSLDSDLRARMAQELVRAALRWLQLGERADTPRVIAGLPGLRNEDGSAPFWNGLGRHFFPGDVDEALARYGNLWQTHVAALLPRHPLVVSVLQPEAQAAIGAIHADALVWRDALRDNGLRAGQHISLHDGGPVFEAHLERTDGRNA